MLERENPWSSLDSTHRSIDQTEVLVEVVVAVENVVAVGCSMVHVVGNSKKVVVAEVVAMEAGSASIAAVFWKAGAGSGTAAGSKNAQTR